MPVVQNDTALAVYRVGCILGWLVLALVAYRLRGRLYGAFIAIVLGVHTLISQGIASSFGELLPLAAYCQVAVFVHFGMLIRGRLRGLAYRLFVSLPASWFAAATLLSWPLATLAIVGLNPPVLAIPFLLASVGLYQSLRSPREVVRVRIDRADLGPLARGPQSKRRLNMGSALAKADRDVLRVVQITDPHLGPFMSESRLRRIVEDAVALDPDVVLLTGDFITMESHSAPEALSRAFAPLLALKGRVFACRGNHDFEAPETVSRALDSAAIPFLIDESVEIQTRAGPIEIIGIDFAFRDRRQHVERVFAAHPRSDRARLRIAMIHDPGIFSYVPDGGADLVVSGHTHGGQIGLVSLGLPGTVVSLFTKIPDHGSWAKGRNRLYVHRGTGHYGFPLRLGVPGEESLLEVALPHSSTTNDAAE